MQPKLAQLSLKIKKSGSNNSNIAIPQKYYQAIVSFKNTIVAATIEKNSAISNPINRKPIANPSCIILSTCIFDTVINHDSQMVNSDLDDNSLGDLHKNKVVLRCKSGMCLLFPFFIKNIDW